MTTMSRRSGAVVEPALRRADAVIGADEVRLHEVEEAVAVARLVRAADAAVRDERVDRAVRVGSRGEGGVDLRAVADVDGADERAADLRRGFRERVLAAREQAQARAVAREAKRDRLADAAARARDDDVPAFHGARLVGLVAGAAVP